MSFIHDNNAAHPTPVSGSEPGSIRTTTHTSSVSARHPHQSRILLVEDDPTLSTLEADILIAYGYSVVTAQSGELAITSLRLSIPDLVVLDLELTGNVNGWEVLQALRSLATIPVLITSSSAAAIRTYIHSTGETRFTLDHLPKPYPLQTLLKRVRRMLPVASPTEDSSA